MMVTVDMVHAAIKQAVKDEILPKVAPLETYEHHWESVRMMLEKAIEASEANHE